jgi:hypothetical protein
VFLLASLSAACSGFNSSPPTSEDGRAIADAFLQDLQSGRVEAAWKSTSAEFKSMLGLEGFKSYIKKAPAALEPAEFVSYEAVDRNGIRMVECKYRSQKKGATLKVLLASEPDGAWKVERFSTE